MKEIQQPIVPPEFLCQFEEINDGEYKCKNCHLLTTSNITTHMCDAFMGIKYKETKYLEYSGKTKSGKYKFKCESCGYTFSARKIKKIEHECSNYKCEFESLGEEYKCTTCGIVLKEKEDRLCPTKTNLKGLGDLVAAGLKKMGIQQKEGCGCGDTQKKLNKIVPFSG